MFQLGAAIDKMMGPEHKTCRPDDPRALALVGAGVDREDITPDTLLSDLGTPEDLQETLGNLSGLYAVGSFAEDLITKGTTIGNVIGHLDQSKFNFAMERLIAMEKQRVNTSMHAELAELDELMHNEND